MLWLTLGAGFGQVLTAGCHILFKQYSWCFELVTSRAHKSGATVSLILCSMARALSLACEFEKLGKQRIGFVLSAIRNLSGLLLCSAPCFSATVDQIVFILGLSVLRLQYLISAFKFR